MVTAVSNEFLTNRAWHRAVVGGRDMILRYTSALEFLELFGGYMREKKIDVYARQHGEFENINYYIVDDFDNIDEQALIEGLSRYYYTHGNSFGGLDIKPENMERFNSVRDWRLNIIARNKL